ncbi:hypothetical protein MXB_3063 [Myxobolus squamalis]|nr:hypothetical protein MXB_3063 [Myxobolus squamalis]
MPSVLNLYLCGNCSGEMPEDEDRCLGVPVLLNIYQVYIKMLEYAFGGHAGDSSGIYCCRPKTCELFMQPYIYKDTVLLGYTTFSELEVQKIINDMEFSYRGKSYNLTLCYHTIPKYVNRIASIVSNVPFLLKLVEIDDITKEPFNMNPEHLEH